MPEGLNTHHEQELITHEDAGLHLVAPNHVRLASVEDQLVHDSDSTVKGIGHEALLALYTSQHIDVVGGGQFWMTHEHGQPTLY